jgi:hypothetical protein
VAAKRGTSYAPQIQALLGMRDAAILSEGGEEETMKARMDFARSVVKREYAPHDGAW